MSVEILESAFSKLASYDAWSIQLLRIVTSKRNGTSYIGREISLAPDGKLKELVTEISKRYVDEEKGVLRSFHDIIDYDGSTIGKTIYKLGTDDALINTEYQTLLNAIAAPDTEIDPLEFKSQAYILKGMLIINEDEVPTKLISMQNPVTTLKHKFLKDNGTFKEIKDKVLSLRPTIDVVILANNIYMLTLAGENLFNMERSYKAICIDKIDDIKDCDIVTDFDSFSTTAASGHNPRKFVSFNENHLQKLKDVNSRKTMATKFAIPLIEDRFDTSQEGTAEKIIKLLCDRGMIDPFDDIAMEVAGSKRWV